MNWIIDNNSHLKQDVSDYIEKIFRLTADHLLKKLGTPPLGVKPIHLKYDCKNGPIVYWPLKLDKYEIGINVDGKFPHQIIFQMAHELCHIYVDPRINGVFTEIICHKTAFDVLEDIGTTLTENGQASIDEYIENCKTKAEKIKSFSLDSIDLDWIKQTISCLEKTNTLQDREINNLIALKLKKHIDPINKYGLVRHVRNSVDTPFNKDTNNLNTTPITKINFSALIGNIKNENERLADILQSWK
jgi:hypothetical protein